MSKKLCARFSDFFIDVSVSAIYEICIFSTECRVKQNLKTGKLELFLFVMIEYSTWNILSLFCQINSKCGNF